MNYLAWLTWLASFSTKLPAIFAELEKIVAAVQAIIALTGGTVPDESLEMVQVSSAEAEAETEVACLLAGPNAAFDGTRLRKLFAFLKDSGLIEVLVTILAKSAGA